MIGQKRLREWVEALRSGKYRQATGKLYDSATGGYCCLGVLCDISPGWTREGTTFVSPSGHAATAIGGLLPTNAIGGLSCDLRTQLAGMNDRGDSFDTIADYIERELCTT